MKAEEYFDLSKDPHERHNIIGRLDYQKIKALRNDVLSWGGRVEASYEQHSYEQQRAPGGDTTPSHPAR
jgi:hypothetical protein